MFGKDMAKMMKQIGMNMVDVPALEVIIRGPQKDIIIKNPQISKISIQGQTTFQVVGEPTEITKEKFSSEDVDLVVMQTGATEAQAKQALEETGDIAEAIMKLKK